MSTRSKFSTEIAGVGKEAPTPPIPYCKLLAIRQ
jgi:hypothetical protein